MLTAQDILFKFDDLPETFCFLTLLSLTSFRIFAPDVLAKYDEPLSLSLFPYYSKTNYKLLSSLYTRLQTLIKNLIDERILYNLSHSLAMPVKWK